MGPWSEYLIALIIAIIGLALVYSLSAVTSTLERLILAVQELDKSVQDRMK